MASIQVKPYQALAVTTFLAMLMLTAVQPGSWFFHLYPVFIIVAVWGVIVTPLAYRREHVHPHPKAKRGVQPDMYAMIDRMLDYLDADEMTYLQRRLAEIENAQTDQFPADLESLLDEREALSRRKLGGWDR